MAGYHGITGWSGGGRRPLTYNLMPGQMRSTRVNVFQSNYIMPMATCYYAEPPCHCEDSGVPKWLQWMTGIGMGSQLLGGILSGIFGGGGSTEGAGGAKGDPLSDKQKSNLAVMRQTYSRDCTISDPTAEGQVCIQGKTKVNGKYPRTWVDVNNLQAKLSELYDTAGNENTETPDTNTKYPKAVGEQMAENYIGAHRDKLSAGSITYNHETGKFKYNGNEYDYTQLDEAIKDAKPSNSTASTVEVGQSTWTKPQTISQLTDSETSPINIPSDATTEFSEEMGANIKTAPKSFEIKDKDGNILYKFELVDDTNKQDSTGEPRYVCTYANKKDLAENQKQEYFMKSDGSMYQNSNTKGFGTPLGKAITGGGKTRSLSQSSAKVEIKDGNSVDNTAGNTDKQNLSAQSVSIPKDVQDWNSKHPNMKVTYDGKNYKTTVTVISTHLGRLQREISATSFEDLKTKAGQTANKLRAQANRADGITSNNGTGLYVKIGRNMNK